MTARLQIYFSGAIRGGRDDQERYATLIRCLQRFGDVLTEHVGDADLSAEGDSVATDTYIFQRDVAWLCAADVVVAEVTTPSLGVGYEIALAEQLGRPILCLFRESSDRRLSAMLAGNPKLVIGKYDKINDATDLLNSFFATDPCSGRS